MITDRYLFLECACVLVMSLLCKLLRLGREGADHVVDFTMFRVCIRNIDDRRVIFVVLWWADRACTIREGQRLDRPINDRVVVLQPWMTKNEVDIMDVSDIEIQHLCVPIDGEALGGLVSDGSLLVWRAVDVGDPERLPELGKHQGELVSHVLADNVDLSTAV